ncbi:MAG: hypothetical protein HC871_13080 [Rhizobiales bacterium]|nr:hypothetical protein [Hyphomicrobiales bacterium]
MAKPHKFAGIMKWLQRDEWWEPFEAVLSRHLAPACDAFDLDPDDLAGILGADVYFNLWGCAFEDFLTRDDEGDGNIVDDYLKRRGWRESAVVKANLKGLRSSVMSLYEVSGIEPGRSFLARDLVHGGEPVRVHDRAASSTVKPWDRIGARLVKIGSKVEMGGGVLLFDHDGAGELLKALGRSRKRASKDLVQLIEEAGGEVDATSSAAPCRGHACCRSRPIPVHHGLAAGQPGAGAWRAAPSVLQQRRRAPSFS